VFPSLPRVWRLLHLAASLHRTSPMSDRRCDLAGAELVERTGLCKVANPELPVARVTVYERRNTADYRERMNAALTASRKLSAGG
jgi:hypothetical protein